jgi:NAD(P)-dependent dehydrogenase (short-subunit alcohol dehydrogenase family)
VVTGGSRGIGRVVAEALAGAGADVVVASRKLDNCETAAREIAEATGRRALPVECHVGRWEECDRLVDTVYDEIPLLPPVTTATLPLRSSNSSGFFTAVHPARCDPAAPGG